MRCQSLIRSLKGKATTHRTHVARLVTCQVFRAAHTLSSQPDITVSEVTNSQLQSGDPRPNAACTLVLVLNGTVTVMEALQPPVKRHASIADRIEVVLVQSLSLCVRQASPKLELAILAREEGRVWVVGCALALKDQGEMAIHRIQWLVASRSRSREPAGWGGESIIVIISGTRGAHIKSASIKVEKFVDVERFIIRAVHWDVLNPLAARRRW